MLSFTSSRGILPASLIISLALSGCAARHEKPTLAIIAAEKPRMCMAKDGNSVLIHECWPTFAEK